jgi:hypothetical protein
MTNQAFHRSDEFRRIVSGEYFRLWRRFGNAAANKRLRDAIQGCSAINGQRESRAPGNDAG